jgi:hypothetical protein
MGIGLGALYAPLLGDGADRNQALTSIHHEDAPAAVVAVVASHYVGGLRQAARKTSIALLKEI